MDQRIIDALLSEGFLKTAEDAAAAGRITARAYAAEWSRLEGLFKGASHDGVEMEEEVEEGEAGPEDGSSVSPEDLDWLVRELGV